MLAYVSHAERLDLSILARQEEASKSCHHHIMVRALTNLPLIELREFLYISHHEVLICRNVCYALDVLLPQIRDFLRVLRVDLRCTVLESEFPEAFDFLVVVSV